MLQLARVAKYGRGVIQDRHSLTVQVNIFSIRSYESVLPTEPAKPISGPCSLHGVFENSAVTTIPELGWYVAVSALHQEWSTLTFVSVHGYD